VADDLVSVIVVNWNGLRFLEKCFTALGAQSYVNRELIMVDNGSTDGSIEFMRSRFPQVCVVRCSENMGFATANNIGFRNAHGNYLATLNNDTYVDPEWLSELVRNIRSDLTIGMCASKMVSWSDSAIIDSAGIALSQTGIAWDRGGGLQDSALDQDPVEIFGPCAGAALYRRELIEQTGGYDDAFFIYLEDVDLAWRAQCLGWRCLYVPAARVRHMHSATTGEGSPFKNYLLGRNKVWVIYKNLPSAMYAWFPLILLYDLLAAVFSVYRYRNLQAIRGRVSGWFNIRKVVRQKRLMSQPTYEAQRARWMQLLERVELPWRIAKRFS
jgi:GT2 family glycosyltransferase